MGIFWLHIRHIGSLLSKSLNAKLFNENLKTWVPGVSVESGLFINKTINFKVGFYKYFATPDQPEFQYLKDWKIKFSLDFTAKQELQKESGR